MDELGAAVAALVTILWIPVFPSLHCYAYAEPCVLSQELSVAAQPFVTALLHGDDLGLLISLTYNCKLFNLSETKGKEVVALIASNTFISTKSTYTRVL